jgi:hypothetical protein
MDTEPVLQGADLVRVITLLDRAGDPVTSYTGAAVLVATLWPGDDQAAATTLDATWVDPTEGTVRLALTAAQSAALDPGAYPVRLEITESGLTASAVVIVIEVLAAPGSAVAPPVYGTYQDMRSVVPWIHELRTDEDQAGFAEQRGVAREWLDSVLLAKVPGGSASGPRDLVVGGGVSSRSWVADLLDADALLLTGPDGKRLKRACALFACGEVLRHQIGSRGETSYQTLAHDLRCEAESLVRQGRAEIDTNDDGTGDLTLDLTTLRVARG